MAQRQESGRQVASTRCPFLMEVTAQCCRPAPFSKLVPCREADRPDQRCSTEAWKSCAWVPQRDTPLDHCPFLDEILACSCAAAPSSKLIPRTVLAVHRCLGDAHRYCEFFLDHAHPDPRAAPPDRLPTSAAGIPIAPGVAIAPNHVWLDVGPDGSCHVGVDAFLMRVLGAVDDVTFLSACGIGSPRVVLTVAGCTLPLVFPQILEITGINHALRRHLDWLTADPYGRGWLYEGCTVGRPGPAEVDARTVGLRRGPDAEIWMASEVRRLLQHVRTILSRRHDQMGPVAADGGEVAAALAPHLDRAELLETFSIFFA